MRFASQSFKYSILIFLCFNFSSSPLVAHSEHEHGQDRGKHTDDFHQLTGILLSAWNGQLYTNASLETPSTIDGTSVNPDVSAMNSVIAEALDFTSDRVCSHCKHSKSFVTRFHGWWSGMRPSMSGFWESLKRKWKSTKEQIQETKAASYQTLYSYDRTIAIYIVVSQSIWEFVETIVSNMILPGGNIHVACTVFNGVLLASAVPTDRLLRLSGTCSSEDSFLKRLAISAKVFRRDRLIFKNAFLRNPKKTPTVKFEAEVTKRMPLDKDIEAFLDAETDPATRWYIAASHIEGLRMAQLKAKALVEGFRSARTLSHKEQLQLEKIQGRLNYGFAHYASTWVYFAQSLNEGRQVILGETRFKVALESMVVFLSEMDHFFQKYAARDVSKLESEDLLNKLWEESSVLLGAVRKFKKPPQLGVFVGHCPEIFGF